MHWPAGDGTPLEEYWQVFTDLKREGKIRAAGLSNHDIFQLEEAAQTGTVDAIQPPFNAIHRDAAEDVLLWAREHEAGAIVYSPMASGLLTGSFTGRGGRTCVPDPVTRPTYDMRSELGSRWGRHTRASHAVASPTISAGEASARA
jgi:aryl-alcohol dehydrogenase-like predicted oxidoreductase